MLPEPFLITGDFNIHVDDLGDQDGVAFLEILESMGFLQHVDKPTHRSGHTLDLIVTQQCDSVQASAPTTDYFLSDHCSILCDLKVEKPALPTKTVSHRKNKDRDRQTLRNELAETKLCLNSPNTLDDLVDCYNSTLSSLLDRHAPLLTKRFKIRPLVPWFNNGIKQARKERRRAEKKWRRTGSASEFLEFKSKRNYTTYLMNTARREFFKEFIDNNSSNPKDLFTATKKLLKHDHGVPFPPSDNKLTLANEMGTFFIYKIRTIHAKLDKLTSALSEVSSDDTES